MKTVLMTAVLAIAFASQSDAASTRSEYCNMAKSQRNTPSWNEHYGCLKAPPGKQAMVAEQIRAKPAKDQFCGMAKSQRNTPSWNEYYGCLR
jgi:hypothetical protein